MRKRFSALILQCMSTAGIICALCCFSTKANAQLSKNPDKFLGNITTNYRVDAGGGVEEYYKLWNQITPENESKWGSVEGSKGSFNWGCDTPFNYAKNHNFTYKFHALVWGAQYPNWFSSSMSANDRYKAIVNWFDAVKNKYPTLPMIDVVNEAVGTHQAGNPLMKESLGGGGKTGYDWLIKAFELAHERWPDAILIYNDYNTFQWDTDNYIDLVRTLRDAGAPIDAYGCQSHDVSSISVDNLSKAMNKIQDAVKMPMYITELDIDVENDTQQKNQYQNIFPMMWEADYCAGVTIWGYIHGSTWVDNSGLIKNGSDRPAMTWLREYMKSDEATNAKSPFPGMKKEASVYIHPAGLKVAKNDSLPILVRADMATKTIEKIELFDGSTLVATMTEAPYETKYASKTTGWRTLKAVVTTTDSCTYERLSRVQVLSSTTKREPYSSTIPQIPGSIVIAQFDKGAEGVSYSNASRVASAATKDGAWMEYTVDVLEDGIYSFEADIAATSSNGVFHLSEYTMDNLIYLTDFISVPNTGSSATFMTMRGKLNVPLTAGRHVICLNVDKGGFYINNISFSRYEEYSKITSAIYSVKPKTITVGDTTLITVTARVPSGDSIAYVKVYANNMLVGTMTEAPFKIQFCPTQKGTYSITAIVTDINGKSKTSSASTLKVNGRRTPYKTIIIPGTFDAENFDKGGEGMTFHDSDSERQGDTEYRTDAEGVDFVKGNNGTAIGYTAVGEWLEYTINVTEPGKYSYEATVSSGTTGSGFKMSIIKDGKTTDMCTVNVDQTGNNDWGTYKVQKGSFSKELETGSQILRITITGANCNIDKIKLICTQNTAIDIIPDHRKEMYSIYNLNGQKVDSNQTGIFIQGGKKYLNME